MSPIQDCSKAALAKDAYVIFSITMQRPNKSCCWFFLSLEVYVVIHIIFRYILFLNRLQKRQVRINNFNVRL